MRKFVITLVSVLLLQSLSAQEILKLTKDELIQQLELQALDPSKEVDKLILEEQKRLDASSNDPVPVWVYKGPIISHPELGVLINRNLLNKYMNNSEIKRVRYMIRFILAHERCHFLQFKNYGKTTVLSYNNEMKRVMEAQADIIAGKYTLESLIPSITTKISNSLAQGGQKEEIKKAIEEEQEILYEAFQLFYDLGENEYSNGDHPTKEQRRSAVKLGKDAGGIALFEIGLISIQGLSSQDVALIQEIAAGMRKTFSYPAGTRDTDWALKKAKKIIHYNSNALKDIVIEYDDSDYSTWHKTDDYPFVDYKFTIKNTGDRTINVDLDVYCEQRLIDNMSKTKEAGIISSNTHKATLLPNTQITFQDKLIWTYASDLYRPGIILPNNPRSFISCEYTSPQNKDTVSKPGDGLGFTDSNGKIIKVPLIVERIRAEAENNFESIKGYPTESVNYKGDFVCYANPCFSSASNAVIYSKKNKDPYVTLTLYSGSSEKIADETYDAVCAEMRNSPAYTNYKIVESAPNPNLPGAKKLSFFQDFEALDLYLERLKDGSYVVEEEKSKDGQEEAYGFLSHYAGTDKSAANGRYNEVRDTYKKTLRMIVDEYVNNEFFTEKDRDATFIPKDVTDIFIRKKGSNQFFEVVVDIVVPSYSNN